MRRVCDNLPIVTVIFNNGGIYRGDGVNLSGGADPALTVLMEDAHYEKLIKAFGGDGYYAANPQSLTNARSKSSGFGPAGADQLRDQSEDRDRERTHRKPQPAQRGA